MEIFFRKMIERVTAPVDKEKYNVEGWETNWDENAIDYDQQETRDYEGPNPDKYEST